MAASVFLLLALFSCSYAQGPIGFDDVCQRELGVGDNLSCPRGDGVLQCYVRSQLCDGVAYCGDGSDEGRNVQSLDCTGSITGWPTAGFVCDYDGKIYIELEWLCDGVKHCPGGQDETSLLCENKCLHPHYGSCPYSRECSYTDLTSSCGLCRPGWASNPRNSTGDCFTAFFSLTETFNATSSYNISEDSGNFYASVRLNTDGQLEQDIEVVVEVLGDSAVEDDDFIPPIVNTFTFHQSQSASSLDFHVPIINDTIQEDTEVFALSATIPSLRGHFSSDFFVVTIIDDDAPPTVRFESVRFELTTKTGEPGESLTNFNNICLNVFQSRIMLGSSLCSVQIRLIQSPPGSVPPWRMPVNFDADPPEVVLNPNYAILHFNNVRPTRRCVELFIANRTQAGRVFQIDAISLTPSLCIVQSDRAVAQVLIPGYDVEFNFVEDNYTVTEGQQLTICIQNTFGILREPTAITMTSIPQNLFNTNCTSIPASYNQIIFLNTTSEEMCFYALAEVDNCIEWQETYTLSLRSNNTNAVFTRDLLITVVDISGSWAIFAPLNLAPLFYTVMENDSVAVVGMTIINDVYLTFPIPVLLSFQGGNATNMVDYSGPITPLEFPPGAVEGHVSYTHFPIIDDDMCEEAESVFLGHAVAISFSGLEVAQFSFNFLIVVINDNDNCSVGFEQTKYNATIVGTPIPTALILPVCLQQFGGGRLSYAVQVILSITDSTQSCSFNHQSNTTVARIEPGVPTECLIVTIATEDVSTSCELTVMTTLPLLGLEEDHQVAEICLNVQCRDLPLLDNGAISYSYEADKTSGRLNGSVASYTCREGFQLSAGDESRVCNNGVWTGSVPECTVVELAPTPGGVIIISIEVFAPVVAVGSSIILALLVAVVVLLCCRNRSNNTTEETVDIVPNDIALDERRQSSINASHEYEYLTAVQMLGIESEVYANEVLTDLDNGSVGSDADEYVIVHQPHEGQLHDGVLPATVDDNVAYDTVMAIEDNVAYSSHSDRGSDGPLYESSVRENWL